MGASRDAGDDRRERGLGQPAGQPADSGAEPLPIEGDFAEEHTDATFAGEQAGGPEGEEEPESPEGYAGMDPGAESG